MLDRLFSGLAALGMAALVWLYARSRDQEILDNVAIPVQITLAAGQADHYSLDVNGPAQVPVSFAGAPSRLRELRGMVQSGELRVEVTLDVPEAHQDESHYHDTVRIEASDIPTPSGVMPIVVEGRNRIPVTLHRLTEQRVPVRFEHPADDHISQVIVEPATVVVRGPQDVVEHLRDLPTQSFPVPPAPEGTVAETVVVGPVPLVGEVQGTTLRTTPESVNVRLTLQPKKKQYEIEVPIHFLCPADFPRRPHFRNERDSKVMVRLLGPASEETPRVSVYIDLTPPGKFLNITTASGPYDEPLQIQLQPGFQLAQPLPRFIAFDLVPLDAAPLSPGAVRGPP